MCYVTVVLVLSVVTYTERVTATCVCDFDQWHLSTDGTHNIFGDTAVLFITCRWRDSVVHPLPPVCISAGGDLLRSLSSLPTFTPPHTRVRRKGGSLWHCSHGNPLLIISPRLWSATWKDNWYHQQDWHVIATHRSGSCRHALVYWKKKREFRKFCSHQNGGRMHVLTSSLGSRVYWLTSPPVNWLTTVEGNGGESDSWQEVSKCDQVGRWREWLVTEEQGKEWNVCFFIITDDH